MARRARWPHLLGRGSPAVTAELPELVEELARSPIRAAGDQEGVRYRLDRETDHARNRPRRDRGRQPSRSPPGSRCRPLSEPGERVLFEAAGGTVIVEDPTSAIVAGMPAAAAEAGVADAVQPLAEIGAAVVERVRYWTTG